MPESWMECSNQWRASSSRLLPRSARKISDEQLAEIERILEAADSQYAASQRVMEPAEEHGENKGSEPMKIDLD
jgi:hypothetical protein